MLPKPLPGSSGKGLPGPGANAGRVALNLTGSARPACHPGRVCDPSSTAAIRSFCSSSGIGMPRADARCDEGRTSWYLMRPRRTICWNRSLSRGAHPAGSEGETTGSPRALTLLCTNSPTPQPRARSVAHRPAVLPTSRHLMSRCSENCTNGPLMQHKRDVWLLRQSIT